MVHIDVPRGAVLHEGQLHRVHVPDLRRSETNIQLRQLQDAFGFLILMNVIPAGEIMVLISIQ